MKGNLFLGFGRRSVGDVVFYKRKGSSEQMARARNRKPNNPRSDKQLYQRAIMATILQAYSAGKAIFDHSFEGQTVPEGSMNRFMSLNLKRLRSAIAADLAGSLANSTPGRVVSPGATNPVPFAYRISEGSYNNQLLTFDGTTPGSEGFKFPTPDAADSNPALYLSNHGFVAGDIYTIVAFGVDPNVTIASYPDGSFNMCYFGWARLEVRSDAPTTGNVTVGNCFNITTSHIFDYADSAPGTVFTIDGLFDSNQVSKGSIGAIRSRYDSGLRSRSDMYMVGADDFGITSADLLEAWRAGTQQVGDPELILEGGGSSQQLSTGEPIAVSGDVQVFADQRCTRYATGSEETIYVRFNSDLALLPTQTGVSEIFAPADSGTLTGAATANGRSIVVTMWVGWSSYGVAAITAGSVITCSNGAGTTAASPSFIMNYGGD